jgi:hypothetical protein
MLARAPAARVRLCAIAAMLSHAAFAVNFPSVILSQEVDHCFELGCCVVEGVVDAALYGAGSAWAEKFRAGVPGRVAGARAAEGAGVTLLAERFGQRRA